VDSQSVDLRAAQSVERFPSGAERLLATPHTGVLTTFRPDGSPHLAPVRFSWDGESRLVRVMTTDSRVKVHNIRAGPDKRVAICQAIQFRWITLEGFGTVSSDPERVSEGVRRYTRRYASPPPNVPEMVVIELAVDRIMGLW
jgi:PPOX class probable F420-dependent enzyme